MNEDGSTIIKIVVQFRDKLAAHNARSKLHKRRFGGKIIHAQTYDKKTFCTRGLYCIICAGVCEEGHLTIVIVDVESWYYL